MSDSYQQLEGKLKELFQLDQGELDFGIYRILRIKHEAMVDFLRNDLLASVEQEFGGYQQTARNDKQKELDKTIESLRDNEASDMEMDEYFDAVLLPRIKKVCYAPKWKGGKPKCIASDEEQAGTPILIKYRRIESYEDALDNLKLSLIRVYNAIQKKHGKFGKIDTNNQCRIPNAQLIEQDSAA